jgi:two-component system NtrC family sensor kinase
MSVAELEQTACRNQPAVDQERQHEIDGEIAALTTPTTKPEKFQYARRMIFLGIIFVPFVTFILAVGFSGLVFFDSLGSSAHEALQRDVADRAREVGDYFEEREKDLDFVFEFFSSETLSQDETLVSVLAFLRKKSHVFEWIVLLDPRGDVIAGAGSRKPGETACATPRQAVATFARGRGRDVRVDEAGQPLFVVSVKQPSDAPYTLCAALSAGFLFRKYESRHRQGSVETFFVNPDGRIFGHRGVGISPGTNQDFGGSFPVSDRAISFLHAEEDGAKYLVAAAPLTATGWMLVVRQPFGDAFNDLLQMGWYLLAVSLLGGAVTLSLAFLVSGWIGNALRDAETVRDVLRERLYRSARLAELGEMSAGFAHEINNPLQVMESEITMMSLIMQDFKESGQQDPETLDRDLKESIGELQRQIKRCSQVTKSILTFGRKESLEDSTIVPGEVMRDVDAMVRKKAEIQSVDIYMEIAPDMPSIPGDASKVRQVLLNLLNNAVYALAEKYAGRPGGRLEFTARPHGQGWIVIEVRDNGPGIPKQVLDNIYTPFFTTKPPQKGTGLGLSVCYGVIESMGGTIDVETRQGEGTVFRLMLPSA